MDEKKKEIFNVPNILSMIRLCMIPATVILIVYDRLLWGLAVFITAELTDLLDGYIARKHNLITKLGSWLDPLADKLMALAVLITFFTKGIVPPVVLAVVLIKELLMIIGGAIVVKRGYATTANVYGKVAGLMLNLAIGSGFMHFIWAPYDQYAMYAATVFVVVAFVQYAVKNISVILNKEKNKEADETDRGER